MFLRFRFVLFLAIALPCVFVSCDKDDDEEPYDVVVDFQDATFPEGLKYNNNSGDAGLFKEGIVSFQNNYITGENWWYGFAYSQMHDMETLGDGNQYSVYAINDDVDNKFMVGFVSTYNAPFIEINFSQPVKDVSFDVANSTYAALCMKDGDNFGTDKFADNDWFKLNISVIKSDGSGISYPSFNMATGSKINDFWTQLTLEGTDIVKMQFSLSSSKNNQYGMLTPSYFCIDNIKARTVK